MENCKICLVEKYPCDSKEELEAYERQIIKATKCINKCVPGRTKAEYYQDNKENKKQYYKDIKETILEKGKQYYVKNKENISIKAKEKFTCDCGSACRRDYILKHRKTQKHQDYLNSLN